MTYQDFISKFTIYPSKGKAKAKGYEAHHIIPKDSQKDNPVFDDRCVRLLPSEHAWAHILWDRENGTNSARVFLQALNLHKKDINEITYEDCLAYNDLEDTRTEAVSKAHRGKPGWHTTHHSDEATRKMREAKIGKVNVCVNTVWVNDGKISKRIPKSEPIPEGFVRGMKPKTT